MKKVKHSGTIVNIDQNSVSVEIISQSACASCKSKTMCQMSESKEKIVDVFVANPQQYALGENVKIVMQESLGLKAVFWAYMMPFLICILSLFGLSYLSDNELVYGIGSIALTAIYFVTLKLFSKKISGAFVWYLE